MSTVPPPLPASGSKPRVSTGQSQARRDQMICVALAVVLLATIVALQPFLARQRGALVREPSISARGLAVAFPRLTLGGFRGLLATALWINAEDDKNNHKWLRLETDYTYIAMLEPYFVTVYTFNAWNQAYNLSAQWHTDDTKYKWVLDGLLHLYEGEEYNPSHPDLIVEQGHMFFLKLGGAYERIYYRKHWRYDIAHLYLAPTRGDLRETTSDSLLEVKNVVERPQFKAEPLAGGHGIAIRDLLPGQKDPIPFKYGISPFYFSYREYLRCLDQPTHPSNIGYQVIQSYPAMSERLWCRDDVYFACDTMRHMFLQENPDTEAYTATGKPPARADFDDQVLALQDCYRNVAMIAPKAINDFEVFIAQRKAAGWGQDAEGTHRKHVYETDFLQKIAQGEAELFAGLVRYTLDNRQDKADLWKEQIKVSPEAAKHFGDCIARYTQALEVMNRYATAVFPPLPNGLPNADLADFQKYVKAINDRIDGARSLLTLEPGKQPDFMFLQRDVVER